MRWNHDHVKLVSRGKLGRFCFGGTSHARQFLVKPEIVLERDGGERLVFFLDLDAFFGFNRLVQSVRPATTFHQTTGEVVDDNYFTILDHVLVVQPVKGVRFQCLLDAVEQLHVRRIVKIANTEETLSFVNAFFGEHSGVRFFIDDVVTSLLTVDVFTFLQVRNDRVGVFVFVSGFV